MAACSAVSVCSAVDLGYWEGYLGCCRALDEAPRHVGAIGQQFRVLSSCWSEQTSGSVLGSCQIGMACPVTGAVTDSSDTHFLNSIVALARAPCSCPLPTTISMAPPPSANSANGAVRAKKRLLSLSPPLCSPLTPPTVDGPASSSSVS